MTRGEAVRWDRRTWMGLAALSGVVGVAADAVGAHGVSAPLAREWIQIGARHEVIHSMATIACATFIQVGAVRARFAPAFFLSGIVLFSGSLYAMAMGAPRWLGAVTPVGGLMFISGWATLAWASRGVDRSPS